MEEREERGRRGVHGSSTVRHASSRRAPEKKKVKKKSKKLTESLMRRNSSLGTVAGALPLLLAEGAAASLGGCLVRTMSLLPLSRPDETFACG